MSLAKSVMAVMIADTYFVLSKEQYLECCRLGIIDHARMDAWVRHLEKKTAGVKA